MRTDTIPLVPQAIGQRVNQLEQILDLIESQTTMVLSTVDPDGRPHSTPLFFVSDKSMNLFWFSSPRCAHSKHCAQRPIISASIFHPTRDWRKIRGVQMQGLASEVQDAGLQEEMRDFHTSRFRLGPIPKLALRKSVLYCLSPTWIRFIDNTRRFGYKFELTFEPAPLKGQTNGCGALQIPAQPAQLDIDSRFDP